jgi:Protein of unknown function (DUF1566)
LSFNYFWREAQEQKMGLFSKSKPTEPPQVTPIVPADKKITLNFGAKAAATALEMAAATLEAGGFEHSRDGLPPIGTKMPDGTIYSGISPDTGKPFYAMPVDAPQPVKWEAARNYAKDLDAHGYKDWRLPSKGELGVLFNNRAAIGGFNVTGAYPAGWYWSASEDSEWYAWGQRFSDGCQHYHSKDFPSSVRCVR